MTGWSFERVVAGFGEVQLRPVNPEGDLDLIHSWVS